jgi:acyl-CoA dehydrogenase
MEFLDPFVRMLETIAPPAQIRAIAAGAPITPILDAVETSGYLDALVSEVRGGAGLSLAQGFYLFHALGQFLVPATIAETMAERAVGEVSPEAKRQIGAVVAAAAISGAGDRILAMTINYANQRVQFGKPIAKQQVIQQQLAVMAEQVVMARIAAQIGCAHGLIPTLESAAIAKQGASRAAVQIAAIAHAVHGAIGISEAHDLSLYTRYLHERRVAYGTETYWAQQLGRARLIQANMTTVDYIRSLEDQTHVVTF